MEIRPSLTLRVSFEIEDRFLALPVVESSEESFRGGHDLRIRGHSLGRLSETPMGEQESNRRNNQENFLHREDSRLTATSCQIHGSEFCFDRLESAFEFRWNDGFGRAQANEPRDDYGRANLQADCCQ